jgi:ferredoxin-NADP reductase
MGSPMKLIVTDKQTIAEDTVSVRLEAVSGPLEPVAPGAHVTLAVNGLTRRYTLTCGHSAGDPYEIQVLRARDSHGGSQWIHDDLTVGDALEGLGVANDFPLSAVSTPSVFIAGGIGITPFLSMAEAVAAAGRAFEVHHVVRSTARQVPIPSFMLPNLNTYAGVRPDFAKLLGHVDRDSQLYVCGPVEMMAVVRAEAYRQGFASNQFHAETFGAGPETTDQPLEVHLALSGTSFVVLPGRPLLDALLEQGAWLGYECRRGQCGSCMAEVLEGEPIHRDAIDPALRQGAMCTCVSWARGPRLLLNL